MVVISVSRLCHISVWECHVCVIWLSSACLSLLSLLHFTTFYYYASHMLLIRCHQMSSDVIGLLSWPQWSAPCGDAKEVPPGEVEQAWRQRRKWRKWRRKMASKTETKLRSLQVKTSIAATISISRAIQRVRTNHLLPFLLQEQGNSRNMERLSFTHLRSSQDAFSAWILDTSTRSM